ncbi:MAG: hypothetical protein HUJ86_00660 [Synergistes sp.]|nr:hypothetical protein [Synergistes sp.]
MRKKRIILTAAAVLCAAAISALPANAALFRPGMTLSHTTMATLIGSTCACCGKPITEQSLENLENAGPDDNICGACGNKLSEKADNGEKDAGTDPAGAQDSTDAKSTDQ